MAGPSGRTRRLGGFPGRGLQDHLQQRAIYKVSGVKTLNETYHSLVGRGDVGRLPMALAERESL